MSAPTPTPRVLACAALLAAAALAGCEGADDDDDTDGGPDDGFEVAFALQPSVGTVVTVTFQRPDDDLAGDEGLVAFGPDPSSYGRATTARRTDDGMFEAVLLGLPPASEVHVQVGVVRDGVPLLGADRTVYTVPTPANLPALTLAGADPAASIGGYRIFPLLTMPSTVVIVDADGQYVWWTEPARATLAVISRATVSRDGRWVLYLDRALDDHGDSQPALHRVRLDGREASHQVIPGAHHDFVELADGTIAVIREDTRAVGDETVVGDAIVEIDPAGGETVVWTSWDHGYPGGDDDGDWTHANGLDYDEQRGVYGLSMRNLDAIYRIDRATGDVLHRIGGAASDVVDVDGAGPLFVQQHQFQLTDDELLVFDNGDDVDAGSRVVDYTVDLDAGTAALDAVFAPDPPTYCYSLGDVSRLDNGHLQVAWSTAGWLLEVAPGGEVVWQLTAELGAGIGYTTWLDGLDPDATAPPGR